MPKPKPYIHLTRDNFLQFEHCRESRYCKNYSQDMKTCNCMLLITRQRKCEATGMTLAMIRHIAENYMDLRNFYKGSAADGK